MTEKITNTHALICNAVSLPQCRLTIEDKMSPAHYNEIFSHLCYKLCNIVVIQCIFEVLLLLFFSFVS